jgi:predicted MPP superfamily phosphohydrolase
MESIGVSLANKRVLITSDWHAPYYDKSAFARLLYQVQVRKPHIILLNGDLIDFYPISTHLRHPSRQLSIQEEIDCLAWLLMILREVAPRADMFYLLGNHEQRFMKYLWRERSELLPLRSLHVANLLNLTKLKIRLVSEPVLALTRDLVVTHGTLSRKRSGYTAHEMLNMFGSFSGMSGHTHRLARVHRRLPDGRQLTWCETGALCQLRASYAPYPDWQHGYGWIEFDQNENIGYIDAVALQETDPASPKLLPAPEPAILLIPQALETDRKEV